MVQSQPQKILTGLSLSYFSLFSSLSHSLPLVHLGESFLMCTRKLPSHRSLPLATFFSCSLSLSLLPPPCHFLPLFFLTSTREKKISSLPHPSSSSLSLSLTHTHTLPLSSLPPLHRFSYPLFVQDKFSHFVREFFYCLPPSFSHCSLPLFSLLHAWWTKFLCISASSLLSPLSSLSSPLSLAISLLRSLSLPLILSLSLSLACVLLSPYSPSIVHFPLTQASHQFFLFYVLLSCAPLPILSLPCSSLVCISVILSLSCTSLSCVLDIHKITVVESAS